MNEEGPPSTADLVALLQRGTAGLINMAKGMEIAWDPASGDPRRVHNMYVRNLVTSYVNRFSELSNGVLIGLDNRDYLIYALCGRSLIETAAILRYYMLREYKPILDRKTLVAADMKKLIDIDDRHLRGTGFRLGVVRSKTLFAAPRQGESQARTQAVGGGAVSRVRCRDRRRSAAASTVGRRR